MTDGLSQLAQRAAVPAEILPPRSPCRTAPIQLTAVREPVTLTELAALEPPAGEPSAVAEAVEVVVAPAADRAPKPAAAAAAVPAPKVKGELKVVTVYLEQDDDDFLETITHTGRTSGRRPRSPGAPSCSVSSNALTSR